ncbi:hypothetical protein EDB82DRAFT_60951 [Fusarium venenatum]|nr:hypothetical protein EDB82DRAFT_60951 [Fusarium venenatum]
MPRLTAPLPLVSIFGNTLDAGQLAEPSPPEHTAPISQHEPVGLTLHGTRLRYFPKPISQRLKDRSLDIKVLYTQSLYESISKRKKDPGNISMKLRHLGLDSQNTALYIDIQCEKRVAKKVRRFFAQEHVEEELLPDFRVLVLNNPPVEVANDDAIDVFSDSLPDKTMCGMSIKLSGGGKFVSCTLGGVIVVETDQTRLYGLIAGHPLKRIRGEPFDKRQMYEAYGSSSSEEEEDSDSDDTSTDKSVIPSKSVHSDIERTYNDVLLRTNFSIGTVVCDSFSVQSGRNCDWALVDLNQEYALPNVVIPNEQPQDSNFQDDKPEITLHYEYPPWTAPPKQVFVLKQGKPCIAELSFDTSSLMISPGSTFIDSHDVIMKDGSSLCPGDSGLWVVDTETSGLYGHVVSVDAFGEAQVMPIHPTFESIKRQMRTNRVFLATSLAVNQLKGDLQEPHSSALPRLNAPGLRPTLESIVRSEEDSLQDKFPRGTIPQPAQSIFVEPRAPFPPLQRKR